MKFQQYLNEAKFNPKTLIKTLSSMTYDKAQSVMKDSFKSMIKIFKDNGLEDDAVKLINKKLKTNYKNLDSISALKEDMINEDFSNFWKMFKMEGWGAVAIFPTLSLWFEADRLLDGVGLADLNYKKIIVYGTFWLFLLLGKHINGYKKWKKDNPDEWEKQGKPGIFKSGKFR